MRAASAGRYARGNLDRLNGRRHQLPGGVPGASDFEAGADPPGGGFLILSGSAAGDAATSTIDWSPKFDGLWATMGRLVSMGSITWGRDMAEIYDTTYSAMFEAPVLNPTIDRLAELARGGPALELAVGTGRVALPLSARGISVEGLELSPHMAEQLRAKPGADAVPVTIGDMTTTRVPGAFKLVYLVANTIMNVTTQEDQIAVFANAAAHLEPGGLFVVEVIVPQLRSVPPGELGRVFTLDPDHVGIETFDDLVGQIAWSHHWMEVDGSLVRHSAPYRYVWPSELDLMARSAGFRLLHRWAGWDKEPFTSDSRSQVAVFEHRS